MANQSAPLSSIYTGWFQNDVDSTLDLYYNGTKVSAYSAALDAVTGAITASTTITAGTRVTVTAGDLRASAGNLRLGTVSAFGTTEPDAWAVFKSSTQPAGAITTSGGVGANDTTVQKIIAAGTVSNVET